MNQHTVIATTQQLQVIVDVSFSQSRTEQSKNQEQVTHSLTLKVSLIT